MPPGSMYLASSYTIESEDCDGNTRSEATDTQDSDQSLVVIDQIGDADTSFKVVLKQRHAGLSSRAIMGRSGRDPFGKEVVDSVPLCWVKSVKVGPAGVAMNDRPGHAVWRRRLFQ